MKDVRTSTSDGDILVFMADATRDSVDDLSLEFVGDTPAILVLNKIDKVKQEDMLPLVAAYTEAHPFEEVIPISALKGRNIEVLLKAISDRLPLGPAFYPKDMVSEQPENFFISEIIREKIFKQFKQEVPYATQVNIVSWELKDDAKDVINAEIIVERDSQKGILIGKGGKAMKKVGTYAREDIEDFLNRGVYLKIHVKVRDNWRNSDTQLRSFGFDK
jgi:GTPase